MTIDYSYGNVVPGPREVRPGVSRNVAGVVAALDVNYNVITASHPAGRGQIVAFYVNGLVRVYHPVSGDPASATSCRRPRKRPP